MIEELTRLGFGGFASGYGIHSNIVAPYTYTSLAVSPETAVAAALGQGDRRAHWP